MTKSLSKSLAIGNDRVQGVLNLTKDEQSVGRLACPFSTSTGIGSVVSGAADTVVAPGLNRLWWLRGPCQS